MFPAQIPHLQNEPLAKYTTYRIGGPARVLAFPRHAEDLQSISGYLAESHEPYFILGNGSNLLPPMRAFPAW